MESQRKPLSPQIELEARQALEAFLTPPKKPLSEQEQAVLAQATSCSVPFGSVDIQTFSWGAGPTVLLVHGWGGYGLQMSNFINPLAEAGYRVLAFDAPAHGSTEGVQTNGLEMAQAIATVAQYQDPIVGIVAHSLGAASTTIALSEGMQTLKVVYLGAICWLSSAAATFARRSRLSPETEEMFRYLAESRFGKDLWQIFSIDRRAKDLTIPALLFHDRRDREVAFEESHSIAQSWLGARLIETSGLGHQRILRNEAVIQQTVDFMTDG
jgi:pimeloyl-ACP methyl ester carboxylesterase